VLVGRIQAAIANSIVGSAVHLNVLGSWHAELVQQLHHVPPVLEQVLVLERNESQASILMGGYRSTLFRDRQADNGVRYSGDGLMLRLNGDELQLELTRPMPTLMQCQRTEDV
jgi:hypothetical protein